MNDHDESAPACDTISIAGTRYRVLRSILTPCFPTHGFPTPVAYYVAEIVADAEIGPS